LQDSLANRTTIGTFAAFVAAMMMLLAPLKRLTEINTALQRGLAAAESVFEMIDAPVEHVPARSTLGGARRADLRAGAPHPIRRARNRRSDGIELQIRPGETVALVGPRAAQEPRWPTCCRAFYSPDSGRCCSTADLEA